MMKKMSKWLTGAAAFGFAAGVVAAPYSVIYTDTASNSAFGIVSGQQATIKLVLDNGTSSVASQTWSAANVQCIIFTFNNAQNLYVAINYSGGPFATTTGNFTTNGSGVLQTVPSDWNDAPPIVKPIVTNIAAITPVDYWFIDGLNEVLFGNGTDINFTNVFKDIIASNWSNPVPANGVCAGYFAPQTQQSIPTLTEWGLVILSSLLVFGAIFSLRRRRQ
jgi:hypothetical protein